MAGLLCALFATAAYCSEMLRNTFCHVPGVSVSIEQKLWTAGLRDWGCLAVTADMPVSPKKRDRLRQHLDLSHQRLENGDCRFFADGLPTREHWRLFPEFRSSIAYLDIETTGLSPYSSRITTIALYDGRRIRHYVHGDNLPQFARDIADYALIVTYNGKCFDVPFIHAGMGLRMDHAHIDLRYVLRSLGYGGGLKGCEKSLGLDRGELDGVDGFLAVLLWHEYRRSGNPRALETLLAYNIQDVVNLEVLLVMAYNLKIQGTPFGESHRLSLPEPPLPFQPDPEIIAQLRPYAVYA